MHNAAERVGQVAGFDVMVGERKARVRALNFASDRNWFDSCRFAVAASRRPGRMRSSAADGGAGHAPSRLARYTPEQ